MLDPRFAPHNAHLEAPDAFGQLDPHLRRLRQQRLVYRFPLLEHLQGLGPGVYSITGGRQIGKSTVLKQWMADMLAAGMKPSQIAYFTGEVIDDHHALIRLLSEYLKGLDGEGVTYVLLDEVTYIKDWDKGIKFLADAGSLERVVLVLTGSDSVIIREARMRFPGRRGTAGTVDFHLFPLTFYEAVTLRGRPTASELAGLMDSRSDVATRLQTILSEEFERYLMHGGYLLALNDLESSGAIAPSTFATYCDWIRGDMLKRDKQERYLLEILGAILRRYGTQVTWNNLAQDLSIDHPATVSDYVNLLVGMDAVFVQPALLEDKLTGAPKKARKIVFGDPFIHHAVQSWVTPGADPFSRQVIPAVRDPEKSARIAESCAVTHIRRFHPTFYIKAEGEVDIAYVDGRRFWPIEVKWTQQLRAKDLKQIGKYRNARIWSKSWASEQVSGVPAEALPLALLRLGPSPLTTSAC
jgi:predicted AAA+ superfamily ATPase